MGMNLLDLVLDLAVWIELDWYAVWDSRGRESEDEALWEARAGSWFIQNR
jgi:hypothetical protein